MSKKKEVKTNAIRIVESSNLKHELHTYDTEDGLIDGMSVASKTGQNPGAAFKTLVLTSHSKEHYVACVPVNSSLDLKKAAKYLNEKKVEMIHSKELLPLTGYIHGGCSPIGMKKQFKTVIDESALEFESIFISGGKIGLQIEINPTDLSNLIGGSFSDIKNNKL